jgi:flagellar motor switch protein FliG
MAAILDASRTAERTGILDRLDKAEPDFAAKVRAASFTLEDVPARIDRRDMAGILRVLENEEVVALLGGAPESCAAAVEFVFGSIPSRLADQIREEIEDRGRIPTDEAEGAAVKLIAEIRRQAEAGDIRLIAQEEE